MITVIVIVGSTVDGRHMCKCVYYMHFSILYKLYTPPVNIPFGKFIFVFHCLLVSLLVFHHSSKMPQS